MAPFIVYALPRSRTTWLSRFLSYGGWHCGHDQAMYVRSAEDVRAWLQQDLTGTVETAAAPWWRLARHYRTDARVVVVRRSPDDALASLLRFGCFDETALRSMLIRQDRALDVIARHPGVMTIGYDDLADEATCARMFTHCLGLPHDPVWWSGMAAINIQADMAALVRYAQAHKAALASAGADCTQAVRYVTRPAKTEPERYDDGLVLQEESFPVFWRDAKPLMAEHCAEVGEEPENFYRKSIDLWDRLSRMGCVQLMTARLNGRMLGYITAMHAPSLEFPGRKVATEISFFITKDARDFSTAMRMQRALIRRARDRGASTLYARAGVRGSGPRLGAMYRRLGFQPFGELYELDLAA